MKSHPLLPGIASLILLNLLSSLPAATLRVPEHHRTIQAAIDHAAPGDSVLVSAGTYKETVRLKPGIELRSAGDNSLKNGILKRALETTIDGRGTKNSLSGISMAEGSILDGFSIVNFGNYDEAKWQKHHATQGEHQSHDHIGQSQTAAVAIINVNCIVRNNLVHHNGHTGIAIIGSASPHVYRNRSYRNMGGGIGSINKSTALIEENACYQNFHAGIGHNNASPTVIKNTCYENIRAGIGISEGACPIVRQNQCYQNRRAGIGIRTGNTTRPIIENNDCYQNDMAGIGSRESAAPIIRGNRCYQNKLAGIGSRSGATPLIISNEIFENAEAGIGQSGNASTTLINNHIHHNNAAGIGFAKCQSGLATVIHNRVTDNKLVAIGIHPGWNVTLTGNQLSRDGGLPPIAMVFKGAQATFTDNTIQGGGVAGIRVAGTLRAHNNRFHGTSLRKRGPPNFAVWALPGSNVSLSANQISTWRHALHATQATVVARNNTITNFHQKAFQIENPTTTPILQSNLEVIPGTGKNHK